MSISDQKLETPHYRDLAGKVAVVAGGSRGIGAATARALAATGVAVAIIAREPSPLEALADSIQAKGGQALAVIADCTNPAELEHAASVIRERLGTPDILAAFVGGQGAPIATAQETAEHWREVVETNLTATFLTVSAFLPAMIERQTGAIITMSSSAARQPARTSAAYAAAKAGVIAFTRQLATETASAGIRVNCLAPGSTENERMRTAMNDQQRAQLAESFPLRRIAQPADIANAAAFLASDAAGWITGITLDVAGGQIML